MPHTDPDFSDNSDAPSRVEHQYDGDTPPSIAIVQAIAAIENVDPMDSLTDRGITLYDHFDPAALDQLVAGTTGSNAVTVDLTIHNGHQYSVQVRDTGHLVVERE